MKILLIIFLVVLITILIYEGSLVAKNDNATIRTRGVVMIVIGIFLNYPLWKIGKAILEKTEKKFDFELSKREKRSEQ
jgi:hypothetical protein